MSYLYDPRNRRRPMGTPPAQRSGELPTLEDYAKLAQAYRELTVAAEAQKKDLAARTAELAIRDEALHRQAEDLKQTQAELMFTRAALEQAQKDNAPAGAESWQERYLRLQAEVENLRRRWEQRAGDETAEARRAILRDMLPLADHLEMALDHASQLDASAQGFVGNIEATRRAFLDTLRRYGVEKQESLGQPFDPQLHEAVGTVATDEVPSGHVAHVAQAGYMEGGKLLRPARVIVSQEQQ